MLNFNIKKKLIYLMKKYKLLPKYFIFIYLSVFLSSLLTNNTFPKYCFMTKN